MCVLLCFGPLKLDSVIRYVCDLDFEQLLLIALLFHALLIFFFGQLNIQLNVAIWNCRCDTALFLRLIHSWCVSCRQLPIAHLNETKSPKLNTHNQIREAAAISIDQLQDLYPKKIPFLNINYFQSTNKMSKQILNLLYYSIRSHFLCSTTTYSFLAISTLSFCIAKNIRWINLLSLPGIACKYVQ